MVRTSLILASLIVASAAIAASAFGQRSTIPTLHGKVGPDYTIGIWRNGELIRKLKAGTYKFVIDDEATIHGFALDGPRGFAREFTSIPFSGTKTVTLRLRAGSYKYYCPAHETMMFGRFKVV